MGALYVLRQLAASSRARLTKCLPSGRRPEWTCRGETVGQYPKRASAVRGWAEGAYHADIPIHRRYPLVGVFLEQFARDELLQRQHHAVLASNPDRRAAVLDRFHGVLDLEVAAIGGEDGVREVVACAY